MFLVNYSKDILYLVLAFCVLWLTFFITWMVYYLIAAARQLHQAAKTAREQVEEVSGLIRKIRLAVEVPSSIFNILLSSFKKFADLGLDTFNKYQGNKKTAKSKNGLNKTKKQSKEEVNF